MGFFNWPPFVAVALDADTGKPLDPNVGMRVKREFYDVKKSKNGQKVMVAHKGGSNHGSKNGGGEDVKKNGNANGNGNANANGNGKKNGNGNGGGEEKKDEATGFTKKGADEPFTPEEDEKIKEMKAEQKSWKEIVDVVGRNQGVLKKHWKEIDPSKGGEGDAPAKQDEGGKKNEGSKKGGKGDKAKGGEDNDKQADKKSGKKDKKDKADKEAAEKKAPSNKAPSNIGSNGQARFTMNEWMTLQEDDIFSFGELQCLSELMMRDERQRWTRIASAFFDKTGRRIHPEDIREKFIEMGALGSQR